MNTVTAAEPTHRVGTAADTDRILELVKLSLGEGRIPRERGYWEWKHRRSPFGESPVLLAEAGGGLVGLRVFLRWEWQAGGRTLRAVRAVDTATHPSWRGRGVFARLTLSLVERMREEGVSLVFNTPNPQSRRGYLKLGWSEVGRMDLWLRPLRPLQALRALLRRGGGAAADGEGEPLGRQPVGRPVAELLREPGLDAWLDGLARAEPRLHTRRTAAYLRWRYVEVPGFEYRAAWEVCGDGSAAAIFRLRPQGPLRELRFCELLVAPDERSVRVGRALLRRVLRESEAHYAAAMAAAGSPERRVVAGAAFLPAPRCGPNLTVLPLAHSRDEPDPRRRQSWRSSIGDLELF